MGRKRKYFTEEEKLQAVRDTAMKYYEDHKEEIKKRNLEKYYENLNQTPKCPIHKIFIKNPKLGCFKCNSILTTKDFIELAIKIHGDKFDYSKVNYIKSKQKVIIICKKHGEFFQHPNAHLNGQGCSSCRYEKNLQNKISKPETQFLDFINIPKENRQLSISGFLVDGYDFDTNTVYEFLGDYWHGNPNKYNLNETNKLSKKTFGQLNTETFKRFDKLKSKGYKIKYIWESDWISFNKKTTSQPNIQTYL